MDNSSNARNGIGLALSGGGSRAIAFHYGVLEALHDFEIDKKIKVVSAISGGAVIAALWTVHSDDWDLFTKNIELVLDKGLEGTIFKKLKHPLVLLQQLFHLGIDSGLLAEALDELVLNGKKLKELPENPTLILNATDLRTGSNFKFSKSVCGSHKDGGSDLCDMRLSDAVACSAAYPLCFKAKKIRMDNGKDVFLTDGGSYDCLGANALMPDKDEGISILIQNCETIITSDASAPFLEDRKYLGRSIGDALYSSYLTCAKRTRSLIYNKMYHLKEIGEIPYLGTIKMDSKHPDVTASWSKADLEFVNGYKTNFKPVTGKAATYLKKRGKESAEIIVKKYLPHLVTNKQL